MSSPPPPFDFAQVDMDTFMSELEALRAEIDAALGPDDLEHLARFERAGRMFTALGLATCWIAPNPISALSLGLGRSARWIMMHHVSHRGYDKVPGVPKKYTSKVFARGKRRFLDWSDWMLPEAWIYEHNVLHHSFTGELDDPDLVEVNAELLRDPNRPLALRYALLAGLILTWKITYYAPNTLDVWINRPSEVKRRAKLRGVSLEEAVLEGSELRLELWKRCYLPYAAVHFGALPLAFLPLGPWASFSALCNSVMAEAITNIHTFCVIGPNHTGDDLPRFDDRPATRAEFYVRQVVGSVNFATGDDITDFFHLWLNYQIEHHIWPDLPMLKYQQFQPRVKALCEKYDVPYLQQGVLGRVKKMLDVAIGKTTMRRMTTPLSEPAAQAA